SAFVFGVQLDESRSAVVVSYLVEPDISHNRKKPALEVAIWHQPAECSRRSQISFLEQILGVVGVASESHVKAIERVDVLDGDMPELGDFSAPFSHAHLCSVENNTQRRWIFPSPGNSC